MELLNSKTKSNQAQPNSTQYIVYRNLDNYQLFQKLSIFFSNVKRKRCHQQNFRGALRCTIAATQKNAHCRVTLQTYFLALTFEPKINMAKTFFLRNFYFKEKQSRLIAKNKLSKNPK